MLLFFVDRCVMKKKIKFIIPSIITLIILLIIFYFQGLYPFDNNSIVQVDADYQFIPVLYRIYDFLHGNGNIIYDDIGLGNNIYISMIIQGSIFSPLSLLLYFTDRGNIVNYFNIIVIVKICLLSLTTFIFINKKFKVNEYYKVVFAVLYAFSGWVILNYFNIMWLDSVILFPLIVMYLDELLNKNNYLGYIITLSMSLVISYYMSYFILLFILFYSFVCMFLRLDKDLIKKTIYKLGIATFISILISSFSLLPALYQTFISSRFGSSYTSDLISNFMNKSLYLMMSSLFLVVFGILITKYKKDKKNIYFYVVLLVLFGIGLFIEPINLAIHLGSYWSFPYRYSFITLFILMMGSLYYIEKYDFKGYKGYQWLRLLIFILLGILLLYGNSLFHDGIIDSQIVLDFDDVDVYKDILIIFSIIVMMIIFAISFRNVKLRYICLSIVCLLQIFIYSSFTMYYSDGYYLSKNANKINNNMNIVNSELGRYKMGYINYTPDYGFIYRVNTLDNWLHILPSNEVNIYKRLGYKNTDTCVRSYGGTIFSDWLFNIKYLIDDEEHDNEIYDLLDTYDNYYLYRYNYNNIFGLIYNKNMDNDELVNGFALHNKIYKELLNNDTDIVLFDNYYYSDIEDSVIVNYKIKETGFVYIYLYNDISYIKVNDNYVNFDGNGNGYIIDLGIYSDDIVIEIGIDDIDYINFDLGFIKYSDIMNLSGNVDNIVKLDNGYDINVNNELDNGYLFLPINNISGLKAYVNDENVDIDSYIGNFVSIKLDNGDNYVKIRYEMPLFKLGIIFSVIGIILLIFFNKIPNSKIILNISYYLYLLVCLLFYLYIYGYSFFKYYSY